MRPILKEWREKVQASLGDNRVSQSLDVNVQPSFQDFYRDASISMGMSPKPEFQSEWDDSLPYFELPKELIGRLRFMGLDLEGNVSIEAALVFGLKEEERVKVSRLYKDYDARFEQLEKAHFRSVPFVPEGNENLGKLKFLLEPFPEKGDALKQEWKEQLEMWLGPSRAGYLNTSLLQPINRKMWMQLLKEGRFDFVNRGPSWLERGNRSVAFTVHISKNLNGRATIDCQFLISNEEGEIPGGFSGSPSRTSSEVGNTS